MSIEWLTQKVPGFAALPAQDREAIIAFSFLWSLFEAQLMGNSANAVKIADAVDQWDAAAMLGAEHYDEDLAYFRNRYFQNGKFTPHFDHLNLRKADMPDLVVDVISGSNDGARDRVLAVLLVVWRFRNNLFHGEKWAYWLGGQFDNFNHANAVLMRVLGRHAGLH
ncbi:hypothetical protein [Agrobacterium cavarae]|uniref:hypothetical protein n=1 Tax=Agrobacterium cavarae TaxID=2528239 RepID=UPI001FE05E6C|nr:hypothetical protein [Agrobacterium cavarae]